MNDSINVVLTFSTTTAAAHRPCYLDAFNSSGIGIEAGSGRGNHDRYSAAAAPPIEL